MPSFFIEDSPTRGTHISRQAKEIAKKPFLKIRRVTNPAPNQTAGNEIDTILAECFWLHFENRRLGVQALFQIHMTQLSRTLP